MNPQEVAATSRSSEARFRCALSCAALVVAGLNAAAFVGGAWLASLDTISNGAPALLVAGAVIWGVAHISGARLVALVALTAGTAPPALVMGLEALAAIRAPAPEAPGLRVLTLNAWSGNGDLARLERLLRQERPDVVLLQEVSSSANAAFYERLAALYSTNVANYPHCGTHVLSRFPLLEHLAGPECEAVAARLALPQELGGGALLVASVHIPRSRSTSAQDAAQRRAAMASWAASSAVVGGDFNATPWSWALRRFDGVEGLRRRTRGLPTWPAPRHARGFPWPVLPIDHVYATQDWRALRIRRGPAVGSDHFPVIVELVRRPPE